MPRKNLVRTNLFPYHIYNRCIDKQFYPFDMNQLWAQCCDLLRVLTWANGVHVHAFVLMSNHYHLLVSTPERNIDESIRYFQTELSRWIHAQTGLQRFRFSGRYKWSIVNELRHFYNVYDYIHQNPVRAGLVERSEEYAFSSLSGRAGTILDFPPFSIQEVYQKAGEAELFEDIERSNSIISGDELESTRRGLRQRIYGPPTRRRRDKWSKGAGYVV